jgi:hypothetical protein
MNWDFCTLLSDMADGKPIAEQIEIVTRECLAVESFRLEWLERVIGDGELDRSLDGLSLEETWQALCKQTISGYRP